MIPWKWIQNENEKCQGIRRKNNAMKMKIRKTEIGTGGRDGGGDPGPGWARPGEIREIYKFQPTFSTRNMGKCYVSPRGKAVGQAFPWGNPSISPCTTPEKSQGSLLENGKRDGRGRFP